MVATANVNNSPTAANDAAAKDAAAKDAAAKDAPDNANTRDGKSGAPVEPKALRYRPADATGVGVIWFDVPGAKVNTLQVALLDQFESVFEQARKDGKVRAIVLASGKDGSFIAGADINDLNGVTSVSDGERLSRNGQQAMDHIEGLPVPVVAAIDGDCLGGGLELALACHGRVASSSVKTKLAFPEVMLGLLPGAGGTTRLPPLVGLANALDMMLTGKNIRATKALKMGLVDKVVPPNQLMEAAGALALKIADGKFDRERKQDMQAEVQELLLERNALGRAIVLREARKKVMGQTKGLYPAPLKILDVIGKGTPEAEAKGFGELLMTAESRGLRRVFASITTLKKIDGPGTEDLSVTPSAHVGMLGAGLMGAGIATVLADKGVTVRLKDISYEAVGSGLSYARKVFGKARKRKRYKQAGVDERMARISGGLTWAGLGQADIVIEAVPEIVGLKQQMVAELEACTKKEAVFATNTSSLPIADIAAQAKHPERVVGMHFFSPVEKMPLVEVIVTDKTAPSATKRTVDLARKMGKHVIVVRDCAGFYTTRVLAPYMIEATFMAIEGYPVESIDEAATRIGFPVGPITLMDEVGIDVGQKVLGVMREHYCGHMEFPPDSIDGFIEEGRLGRKAGKGFYVYEDGESKTVRGHKVVDEAIYRHLPNGSNTRNPNLEEMGERLLLALVNEAVRCLEEGILLQSEAGDLGAVMGIGFPPFLGGPFHYVDEQGAKSVAARLRALELRYGRRFAPTQLLVDKAEAGTKFTS